MTWCRRHLFLFLSPRVLSRLQVCSSKFELCEAIANVTSAGLLFALRADLATPMIDPHLNFAVCPKAIAETVQL